MASGRYQVDPALLEQVTRGINDAMSELKELGIDATAETGRGFDALTLSGMEVGHQGLAAAFDTFCDRWEYGVRGLMAEADGLAHKLDLNAGTYHEEEQYLSGKMKNLVSAGMGDPALSSDTVSEKSWGAVLADNPAHQALHADYDPLSEASLAKARDTQGAWRQTVDGLPSSPLVQAPLEGMAKVTGENPLEPEHGRPTAEGDG